MADQIVHLVDDDEAIRHSASFMLRHAGYKVKTYPNGISFLDEISTDDRGCILLDVRMPVMDGLAVQAELKKRGVAMPVIILTGHGDVPVAVEAMKGGALEFLEKPYEKQALTNVIKTAFAYLETQATDQRRTAEAAASIKNLTPREFEVLEHLVDGLTNKQIAEALAISPRTVEIHRAHVMDKLKAESLSSALRIAFLAGVGVKPTP